MIRLRVPIATSCRTTTPSGNGRAIDPWRYVTTAALSGFLPKYANKASNGFWHSFYFTTGNFPDNIQITPGNRTVAADACLKCHEPITRSMSPGHDKPTGCLKCHGKIGHPQ